MWKKAAVEISDALIHITTPFSSSSLIDGSAEKYFCLVEPTFWEQIILACMCVWSDGVHPSGDIDRTPGRMLEVGPCGLPPWASKPKHRCYVDVPWWEYPRGLQSGTFRCNSNSSLFNRRHLYCYERTKRVPRVQLWDLNPWAYWLQSWDVALKPSATTDSDHIHFYSGLGQRDMLQK